MKRPRSILLAVFAFGLLSASAATAQTNHASNKADDVRKLERAWLDAYEKRDVAAMTAIVADDFTITFADGSVQTKPQVIESIKRASGPPSKFYTENVQARVYGDTVVLIGLVVSEWKQGDKTMTDRSRYTDTYVRRNGQWQVVASHLSSASKQ